MFKVMAGVVALAAAGSVAWGATQGVSVGEIIHGVEHLTVAKDEHGNWSIRIKDPGDEVGFVKAMHDDAAFNKFNAAEMLQMGRTTCGWLRNGSGPNEIINWMDQQPGMAGFSPVLLHKVELDLITSSQVYLCPDTLHNGTVSTTTTTPTPTAPPAPTTMVATTAPGSFQYVPLWPFASQQEADRWLRDDAPNGISRWHADPEATALNFTQNYLGFSEIDRVTHVDDQGEEAWVSVGYTLPNGEETTAATIHLVRYGTGPNAAWEVVGTEDATLTVTAPPYGSSVGPVVYAGGAITGVDEAVHVQLRQSTQQTVLGEFCCVQTGGNPGSWSAQVHVNGAQSGPLTMVVWTGGHVARVEQFAITGLHAE